MKYMTAWWTPATGWIGLNKLKDEELSADDLADYGMGDPAYPKEMYAVGLKHIHDNAMAISSRIGDLDGLSASMAESIAEYAREMLRKL